MDLALAHALEGRLAEAEGKLDATRFAQLVARCRDAKELLLGDAAPDDAPVTVVSPGAKLVGGTRTTRLSREDAERIVLEGFLPLVPAGAQPQRSRSALVGFGLPYEREVAITRHVAGFIARHVPGGRPPDAVLLNGGVFRAARIAARMVDAIAAWRQGAPVTRLPTPIRTSPSRAGAVAYALARLGQGVRIGGGSARAYFVAVGEGRAVCVVPRGAEEGVIHGAEGRTFALATGRPVRFDVLASDEIEARAGEVVDTGDERLARLPPLATVIEAEAGAREARVAIQGELTPVGTLDLSCVEVEAASPRRFRLAFSLRAGDEGDEAERAMARSTRPPDVGPRPSRRVDAARELLDRAFGKPRSDASGREAKDLLRDLEKTLGERAQWTAEDSRALFDALLPDARARRRSADHERVFWLLAGFCVRPGFGDPLDAARVAGSRALWDERLAFPGEARGWQQLFIAWRRAAGGLDEAGQSRIRDFVDPHLAPSEAGLKRPKKPALSLDDALDMASSLERVTPARRADLGGWISSGPGRIGTRGSGLRSGVSARACPRTPAFTTSWRRTRGALARSPAAREVGRRAHGDGGGRANRAPHGRSRARRGRPRPEGGRAPARRRRRRRRGPAGGARGRRDRRSRAGRLLRRRPAPGPAPGGVTRLVSRRRAARGRRADRPPRRWPGPRRRRGGSRGPR